MGRRRGSLLSKVIFGVSLGIVAIEAILLVPTTSLYRRELVESRKETTAVVAELLVHHRAQGLAAEGGAAALAGMARELARNRTDGGETVASVYDRDGGFLAGEAVGPCCSEVGQAAAEGVALPYGIERDGELHHVRPVRAGKDGPVVGYLLLVAPLASVGSKVLVHVLMAAGLTLVILLVTGIVTIQALYRFILRPIGALTEANRALVVGDEAHALVPEEATPDDEIGDVIRSRNGIYRTMLEYQASIREKNAQLKQQQVELRRWALELERRVRAKSEELQRAHERLLETEKLAAAGRLAAGVAHEINNPLASIAGYAEDLLELAKDPALAPLPQFQDFPDSLRTIEEQAYRCKKIIRQLLSFARPGAFVVEACDVGALVTEILPLVEHKAKGRDIPIVVDVEPPPDADADGDGPAAPLSVLADRVNLQQVLLNLIENALDAIPGSRGQVSVRASARPQDGAVAIEVEDSGVGIPEAIRARVFDPFFTTKPVGSGTGLGLSICYGIVRKLKGTIAFTSEVGKGTTFVLTLPAAAPAPAPARAPIPAPVPVPVPAPVPDSARVPAGVA